MGRNRQQTLPRVEVCVGSHTSIVRQECSPAKESRQAREARKQRNKRNVNKEIERLSALEAIKLKAIKDGKRPLPAPPPAPFVDIIGPSFSSRRDDDGMAAHPEPVGDLSPGNTSPLAEMPDPMPLMSDLARVCTTDDVATGSLDDDVATGCAPYEPSSATPAATPRSSSDGSEDEIVMEAHPVEVRLYEQMTEEERCREDDTSRAPMPFCLPVLQLLYSKLPTQGDFTRLVRQYGENTSRHYVTDAIKDASGEPFFAEELLAICHGHDGWDIRPDTPSMCVEAMCHVLAITAVLLRTWHGS